MQMNVLGITLTDLGLVEALNKTDHFLNNGAVNTISYVSMQKLVSASENEEERLWMEELDMTVCEDVEVLRAAGISNRSRIREVEQNEFLFEFLRRVKNRRYDVFLFTDTRQNLERLENELQEAVGSLPIRGRAVLEEYGENLEGIWNTMNAAAPHIIFSRFPYPQGIRFMHEYKKYLNGRIWIALSDTINVKVKGTIFKRLERYLYKRIFVKKVNRFQEEKKKEADR